MYVRKYVCSMYVLCTPLYECVMKKEVQGRWSRVATRCAAIAVCTSTSNVCTCTQPHLLIACTRTRRNRVSLRDSSVYVSYMTY